MPNNHKGAVRALCATAFAAILVSTPAAAQEQERLNMPAQPLNAALLTWAERTGQQLVYDRTSVAGLRSTAVAGAASPEQALTTLLVGTGFTFESAGPNTVRLRPIVADAGGATVLPPVVVRGELQTRALQDTPTSVAVFEGEALQERGETNIFDAIERTPNVSTTAGDRLFVIRGINQIGNAAGGSGLLVSTQVDGAALPNFAASVGAYSTWDLQQAEVLRGPQSTQQGRNALAGAIVLRSNDPTYDYEARIRGTVGNYETGGGSALVNVPLIDDRLALRVSADVQRSDGFVENPTRGIDDEAPRNQDVFRGKLRFDPTDDIEIIASYEFAEFEANSLSVIQRDHFPDDRIALNDASNLETSIRRNAGLRANWFIGDNWSLESETTYLTNDYRRLADQDGTAEPLRTRNRGSDDTVFEQDIRGRYESERIDAVIGGFYTRIEEDFFNVERLPAPGLPGVTANSEFSETEEVQNYAVYGEADISLDAVVPGLSVTLGARYDIESFESSGGVQVITTEPALGPAETSTFAPSETDFAAFLPKLGITYDWTPDISTTFTVQRGYRAGGVQIVDVDGDGELDFNEFDPEYTWNYELAVRGTFLEGRINAGANVFLTEWTDQQLSREREIGEFVVENAGESRLYGAELSVDALVTEELSVFVDLGVLQTEFLDAEVRGSDFTGNEFGFAPPVSLAFGGEYDFGNGLSVGADASYEASSFRNAANDPSQKSDDRFLVNARLNYAMGSFAVGAFVRNLFDVDYVRESIDDDLIRAGAPRTFGVFGEVRF